jgi:hypothetical protein
MVGECRIKEKSNEIWDIKILDMARRKNKISAFK